MTREEASNRLKQWIRNGCDGMTDERLGYIEGWFHKSDKEAFEQAIKALEQEPTDDYFRKMAEVVISQLRTDRDRLEDELAKLEQEPILDKIEPKCDRINSIASVLPYTAHREIQELLCEIMDLCKESEEI